MNIRLNLVRNTLPMGMSHRLRGMIQFIRPITNSRVHPFQFILDQVHFNFMVFE